MNNKARILIVDDESALRDAYRDALTKEKTIYNAHLPHIPTTRCNGLWSYLPTHGSKALWARIFYTKAT